MSDTKHSKTPWHYGGREVLADDDTLVCSLSGWKNYAAIKSDGERIVACVNACAGLDDPAAEIAALRTQLADATRKLEEARKDADNNRQILMRCADDVAYVAFNIDGSKLQDLNPRIVETSEPSVTALLVERRLRAIIKQGKGGDDE
jgi:hypothetical protein